MGAWVYLVPDVVVHGAGEVTWVDVARASAGAHEPRRDVHAGQMRT